MSVNLLSSVALYDKDGVYDTTFKTQLTWADIFVSLNTVRQWVGLMSHYIQPEELDCCGLVDMLDSIKYQSEELCELQQQLEGR